MIVRGEALLITLQKGNLDTVHEKYKENLYIYNSND